MITLDHLAQIGAILSDGMTSKPEEILLSVNKENFLFLVQEMESLKRKIPVPADQHHELSCIENFTFYFQDKIGITVSAIPDSDKKEPAISPVAE